MNKVKEGMEYLIMLEKEILPTQIYTVPLLKGKFNDLEKHFQNASKHYQLAFNLYQRDFEKQMDKSVLGNIQFRLGWAMIRSRQDVNKGIFNLKQANALLPDNFDIKLKLAQIYLQE
jgi:tetratricopeptide (TPR) repeat protein